MSFGDAVRKSMDSDLLDNRDPEALPKGRYKVTIDGGSAFTSRAGDDYAKVVLAINEGPVEGRFEHFMGFGSAMQEQINGEALAAYGINWTEIDSVKDLDMALGELVGTTAEIGVSWNDKGFLNINVHGSRPPAEKAAQASETTPAGAGADFAAAASVASDDDLPF
jgi:hypothetical protein